MTEGECFEDDAVVMIGEKVLEMADRLRPVDRAAPGAQASYAFELDGVTFEISMKVRVQ